MTPRRILVIGWLVFVLYAYPGYLSTESIDQLVDSRIGEFTDWQSPVMTELWRLVGLVVSGPAGMLFLQSTMLLAGAYALLRRALTDRAAAVVACAILVFPPVIATLAVIWPDSVLAAFLVAGAAALASPRRITQLAGLGLLLLACGMTDGAPVAAMPIVVLGWSWRAGLSRARRYAIAGAAWLAITGVSIGLTHLLVDHRTERNEVELAIDDVIGVIDQAGTLADEPLRAELEGVTLVPTSELQQHVRAVYGHPERYTYGPHAVLQPPDTAAAREALLRARHAVMRAHPAAYVAHRWHQLVRVLGLTRGKTWRPVYASFVELPLQRESIRHTARHAPVQKGLLAVVRGLGDSFLFHPYLYFLLALVLLPVAAVRRQADTCALLASGVLYELAVGIVTAAPQANQSLWLIVATLIALVLLVVRDRR